MTHADTHRRFHELFNERRFDDVERYLAPGFTMIDRPRDLVINTATDLLVWMRGWVTAFPDARITDGRYLGGDAFSVCRFRGRGVMSGPLGDVEPTGERMDLPFCEVLTFNEAGRVHSGDIYYDQATLLNQIGLTTPETPGQRPGAREYQR